MTKKWPLVSFIGSGHVAWHLAPALDNAGLVVKEVYSRNPQHAEALTERLYQAEVKASLDFSTSESRLFVMAVTDGAIEAIAQEIILPEEATLVHTSGSVPLDVLAFAAPAQSAVFYPLQTFTRAKRVDFQHVPVLIETMDEQAWNELYAIAKAISARVHRIDAEKRVALHVAAVFASNFTNHLLRVSQRLLETHQLPYDLIKPLVAETIQKSLELGPQAAQTGPARRGVQKKPQTI
ncbi:MAG: DUF2520 domain-containing protein [Cyclobacteriaceae bacterium]|nr:DUF2520 domain-containing protein [Cyclobacteriaceae bacterium]